MAKHLFVRYAEGRLEASGDAKAWFVWTPPPPPGVRYVRTRADGVSETSEDGIHWQVWVTDDERALETGIVADLRKTAANAANKLRRDEYSIHSPHHIKLMIEAVVTLERRKTEEQLRLGGRDEMPAIDYDRFTEEELDACRIVAAAEARCRIR